LFGAPGIVRGADESEIVALQQKRVAVLAYLAVARPGPLHRRDSLLAMFWPELDANRGRNALSKAVHHLRRSLPPGAILTRGDQIGIASERLWCDVTEFERALESGRTEDAVSLYSGDLLPGFHIAGAPDFDHWLDVERSRLRRMAVAAAWELVSDAEKVGEGARAIGFARQAFEWAPRDESGFRRFLTLLQRLGNRAQALAAFETFADRLRRDYGVDPAGPTLELVQAIRDGALPSDLAEPLAEGSDPAPRAPTIERSEPAPAGRAAEPEPPTEGSLEVSERAPSHPRPRRRFVGMALAIGLVGLTALALLRNGPVLSGEEERPAGRVLVTEFEDGRGEGLGAVVSEALRIDLAQSRVVESVDRADIVETLKLMGLEANAPISAKVGREVAVRDGLEALVEGTVVPAGTGYILTAAIRSGNDGRTIMSFRRSVSESDLVIPAIDELSVGVREALGEKLGTIRASPPLARVTTPSLEALTLYTRATNTFDQIDDRSEAASLLLRAVTIDPGFAMAWRMLAVATQNDADQSLRLEAARQAYLHRDRLSELERYTVEASYYVTVEEDRGRAARALLRILDVDPENTRALNNLGINYLFMSEPESAEEVFRRVIETPGVSSTAYRNLVETRLSLGKIEEASQTLAEFEQAYPDHELLTILRARTLFLSGATDEARAVARRIVDDPLRPAARRADAWAFLGRMAYWEGKHEDAHRAFVEAERVDTSANEAAVLARVVETALTAALVDDGEWARAHHQTRRQRGLAEGVALDRSTRASLIELSTLTSATEPIDDFDAEIAGPSRLAEAYARIQAGDTVGLRADIEQLPLHLLQRVLLAEQLGDLGRTIQLYEEVLKPGYTGWGNTPHRLRAFMRLGPLHEEAGNVPRAIEAYDAFAQLWSLGDERGRAVAERFASRARALETETPMTRPPGSF
jgi:DNA-binding SARP family transcriptional activator/predicted Zn-dependent protease